MSGATGHQGGGALPKARANSPARKPLMMQMIVAAAIAVPLTLIVSANLPNGILSSVSIGYSTGVWTSPPLPEESMQKQVRMLQEQMDNLIAMQPGADASNNEQQRWQEMRRLLSRQVELALAMLEEKKGVTKGHQESHLPQEQEPMTVHNQEPQVPLPAQQHQQQEQQHESQAQQQQEEQEGEDREQEEGERDRQPLQPSVVPDSPRQRTPGRPKSPKVVSFHDMQRSARAKRHRHGLRRRHEHPQRPGGEDGTTDRGRQEAKAPSYMQKGAVGIPLHRKPPKPPPPPLAPPAPLRIREKQDGVTEFALMDPHPRYRVPPKSPKFATLPDSNGTWRSCFNSKQQCRTCVLGPGDPKAEPCVVCTHCPMTLAWPDSHPRVNPTLSAKLLMNEEPLDVYVKFPCIPTNRSLPAASRVDPHHRCDQGNIEADFAAPARHVMSIQRISDDCGLDGIAARYWVDVAMTVVDDGPFVHQNAVFAQTAPGTAIEKLNGPNKRERIRKIPVEQILQATLHDFILCEGDRHQGNIYIDNDNNILLIDNDRALGNKASMTREMARQGNLKCQPSSLFLPMTMESNRLNGGPLGYLDYRCHTGEQKDLFLPPKVKQCLVSFADMTPEQLKQKYDILFLEWAQDLHDRAKDILELGFWEALNKAVEHGKSEWHRLAGQRPAPDNHMFPHWRGAFWRPLVDAKCDA